MKLIMPIIVIALIAFAVSQHDSGPTPEQQAIAVLQGQVDELRNQVQQNESTAKALAAKPVETPKPLPFADAYPEQVKVLEGLNTAVNKCVDACTHASIEIESMKADLAKLSEATKTCEAPAEKKPAPKYTVTLPSSTYDLAVASANATGRDVLFVLRQDGCYFCDELEQNVTHNADFQQDVSQRYVLSEINISRDAESARHFNVRRTPAVLVFDPRTNVWKVMQTVPRNIPAFMAMLRGL